MLSPKSIYDSAVTILSRQFVKLQLPIPTGATIDAITKAMFTYGHVQTAKYPNLGNIDCTLCKSMEKHPTKDPDDTAYGTCNNVNSRIWGRPVSHDFGCILFKPIDNSGLVWEKALTKHEMKYLVQELKDKINLDEQYCKTKHGFLDSITTRIKKLRDTDTTNSTIVQDPSGQLTIRQVERKIQKASDMEERRRSWAKYLKTKKNQT